MSNETKKLNVEKNGVGHFHLNTHKIHSPKNNGENLRKMVAKTGKQRKNLNFRKMGKHWNTKKNLKFILIEDEEKGVKNSFVTEIVRNNHPTGNSKKKKS